MADYMEWNRWPRKTYSVLSGDMEADRASQAPEGPHIFRKDGYYYLLVAEGRLKVEILLASFGSDRQAGGTGVNHMVTMARATTIDGPYKSNPSNPILTNANTSTYFQTVGHADLFQDASGNWFVTMAGKLPKVKALT
jgi:beta-xylosidase